MAWIAREEMDSKRSFLGAKSKSDIVAVEQLQQNCFGSSLLHGLAFAMLERSEGLTSITSGFCPQQAQGCVESGAEALSTRSLESGLGSVLLNFLRGTHAHHVCRKQTDYI